MAGVVAGLAFLLGAGDWTPLTTVVGTTLVVVIMAYHRGVPELPKARNIMGRSAFGGVGALSICLALAWPIQIGIIEVVPCDVTVNHGSTHLCGERLDLVTDSTAAGITLGVLAVVWVVAAFILAVVEPRITERLDR
jgi:hypothetical protein